MNPASDLYQANTRIIAARCAWPVGAVDAALALTTAYPDWLITWSHGGLLHWRQPGWYAVPRDPRVPTGRRRRAAIWRATADELDEVLPINPRPDWTAAWSPPGGWT